MSKVVIVSDSHGLVNELQAIIDRYDQEVDAFIHCGDSELPMNHDVFKTFRSVKGNCDHEPFPAHDIIMMDNKRILFTHGHEHGVKFNLNRLYYLGEAYQADVICYGHSHRPLVRREQGILFINPGSIKHNRVFRMKENTFAILTIDHNEFDVKYMDIKTFQEITL